MGVVQEGGATPCAAHTRWVGSLGCPKNSLQPACRLTWQATHTTPPQGCACQRDRHQVRPLPLGPTTGRRSAAAPHHLPHSVPSRHSCSPSSLATDFLHPLERCPTLPASPPSAAFYCVCLCRRTTASCTPWSAPSSTCRSRRCCWCLTTSTQSSSCARWVKRGGLRSCTRWGVVVGVRCE